MVQCAETIEKAKVLMDELYKLYDIDVDALDIDDFDEEDESEN